MPRDATEVHASKTQFWIKCYYNGKANSCQIFNAGGVPLYDEVFLPYDGGPPATDEELKIDPTRSYANVVWLRNGRMLLPTTNFEREKKFWDKIFSAPEPGR